MVKLIGPLFSVRAHGHFGKSITYATNGDTQYAKNYAVPTNPRSPAQTRVRMNTAFLSKAWKNLTIAQQNTWGPAAAHTRLSPYHEYLRTNCGLWRDQFPWKPALIDPAGGFITLEDCNAGHSGFDWDLEAEWAWTVQEPWGFQICASTSRPFSPSNLNTIALISDWVRNPGASCVSFLWTAPDTMTWYFQMRALLPDGTTSLWGDIEK
jgi:hypothetical protein